MPDFLQRIVAHKRQEIAAAVARVPVDVLRQQAAARRDYRGFAAALASADAAAGRVRIIAEIKRASPSKGDLRPNLDPAALARAYEAGGAAALSVLTERAFFKGSPDDLAAARQATSLPVLRKDFIFDDYQVYESAAMGADAILLIVRLLTDDELTRLNVLARSLGLDVLVEVYDAAEAVRANRLGARLVGINNRDLARFDTDVTRAQRVAAALTPGTIVVAASGIAGADDICRAHAAGIFRFLIGETLVRSDDPAGLLRAWNAIGPIEIKICGLTSPETAAACAAAGADAIGMVFHPPSPRHLTLEQACDVAAAVPAGVAKVGVFATQDQESVLRIASQAGLDVVQLHGACAGVDAAAFTARGLRVVRVLRATGAELAAQAQRVPRDEGILVECGQGVLPGGNGIAWRWSDAAALRAIRPFAVAGGLTPDNVDVALAQSGASAVDVSSGVECAPGIKDPERVRAFVAAARAAHVAAAGPVFHNPL